MIPRIVFILLLLVSASGFVSPPVALAMGLAFGLILPHPYGREAKKYSKFLLQASVVGLGFGMNLHQVIQAGRSGFIYTMLGISFALLVGMGLGALLGVQQVPARRFAGAARLRRWGRLRMLPMRRCRSRWGRFLC